MTVTAADLIARLQELPGEAILALPNGGNDVAEVRISSSPRTRLLAEGEPGYVEGLDNRCIDESEPVRFSID